MNEFKNIPLTHNDVANLPIGYNITGYYPNRAIRRSVFQHLSSQKGRTFQHVLGGFQKDNIADEGSQIIPMWDKKVPYLNYKGQETGYFRDVNGVMTWFPNMIWEMNPEIREVRVVKIIEHSKGMN